MFAHIAYFMIFPLRRPWSYSFSGIHSPASGLPNSVRSMLDDGANREPELVAGQF